MNSFFSCKKYHLVGIKGVAMTSMAQLLIDAGKEVTGTDVREDFVTKKQLDRLGVEIFNDFEGKIPEGTGCVIYTAAHGGPDNFLVKKAKEMELPVFSHAEALALFFNAKDGIAVCGVGGKSTVSAMLAYIFEKVRPESFSVGVGNISGVNKTGQWLEESKYFVAEADEYVIDPLASKKGEKITPRFAFLRPEITVCTNLQFDHPDVYQDFAHTQQVFKDFFSQTASGGSLVINGDDEVLVELVKSNFSEQTVVSFGKSNHSQLRLVSYDSKEGQVVAKLDLEGQEVNLVLQVPGEYNLMNAMAAILAARQAGVHIEASVKALATFSSTMRRFELIGTKNGVTFYDDYAHHPREIEAVLKALAEWYPSRRKVIAFQPHTFSRTKELFDQFVQSFSGADKLILLDIFASAREKDTGGTSSELLKERINELNPLLEATNVGTIHNLANYFNTELQTGDVVLTIGAGDIYKVHDLVE